MKHQKHKDLQPCKRKKRVRRLSGKVEEKKCRGGLRDREWLVSSSSTAMSVGVQRSKEEAMFTLRDVKPIV